MQSSLITHITGQLRRLRGGEGLTVSNSVFFSNSELEHLDVFDITQLDRRDSLLNNLVVERLPQRGDSAGVRLWIVFQLSRAGLNQENINILYQFLVPSLPSGGSYDL